MANRHQQLTGPDRWQVSYADLLTLLLGLFIVMYAVASMEKDQKKTILEALQNSFSNAATTTVANNDGALDGLMLADALLSFDPAKAQLDGDGEWVYLQVASETLFKSGSAVLIPAAELELKKMVDWIASTQGAVEIEGYTDNVPIHTEAFPDNWSLSSARAVAIASYLTAHGVAGKRMKAIGFGEYAPIADNATDEGRQLNRRVVIKVENLPVSAENANFILKTPNAELNKQEPIVPSDPLLADKAINKNTDNTATQIPENPQVLLDRIKEKGLAPERLPSGGLKFSHTPR